MDELQETIDTLIELDEPETIIPTLRRAAQRRKGHRWQLLARVLAQAEVNLDEEMNARSASDCAKEVSQPQAKGADPMAHAPHPTPPPKPANHQPPPSPPSKPPVDPQAAKVEAHAKEQPAFTPKPALDPRAEKPPQGAYADGMPIADEQRARSAWIEAHGVAAYLEATDERSADERTPKQVAGVTPPTKRE